MLRRGAVGDAVRLAAACLGTAALAGCGTAGQPSPAPGAAPPSRAPAAAPPSRAPGATQVTAVAASCARLTGRQQFRAARAVFDARMLRGRIVGAGTDRTLRSPARVRVIRWLKGHGPPVVFVDTAVSPRRDGIAVAEDGIEPLPGQTWRIYSNSRRSPYATSICAGSRRLRRR